MSIYEVAEQIGRLCPADVSEDAGYSAHEGREGQPDSVGWYCDGGNAGNPVLTIPREETVEFARRLAALPDGHLDGAIKLAPTDGLRVEWLV